MREELRRPHLGAGPTPPTGTQPTAAAHGASGMHERLGALDGHRPAQAASCSLPCKPLV